MSKRSNRFSRQRRRFMQESLAGLGGLYLSSCSSKNLIAEPAPAKGAKYLVNIQIMGGYDLHWFTSTTHSDNIDFENNLVQQKDPNTGAVILEYHNRFTRRHTEEGYLMHPNYPSDPQSGIPLGLGMANVFGSVGDPPGDPTTGIELLRDKMTLWNGMNYDIGHGIANRLLLHGSLTSYALTYSSLIAGEIAKRNPRPLHYVQMTASPEDFNANWALTKGYEVPINMPDMTSFVKLTTPPVNDFQIDDPVERKVLSELNRTVAAIGDAAVPAFELNSSRSVFETFISAFKDAVRVGTSNITEDPMFNRIWTEYEQYATSRLEDLVRPGSFFDTHNLSRVDPEGHLTERGNPWFNIPAALGATINSGAVTFSTQTRDRIRNAAFYFAAAEYLIRRDDTAVVDIRLNPFGGDFHDRGDSDVVQLTLAFALVRKMLGNFSKYNVKNDPGTKLIDAATLVMFSEFDRTHNVIQEADVIRRGTNHGSITSAIIAGAGCAGGRVVGALASDTGYYSTMKLARAGRYRRGCPVDPVSGALSMGGIELDIKSIFPTMLTMFNVEVPGNQLTDHLPVPAIIDEAFVSERRWKAVLAEMAPWIQMRRKHS